MNDLFEIEFIFKYQDWSDKVKKITVQSFMFDDTKQFFNNPFKISHKSKYAKHWLICKCKANDWRDNGRDINEYECGQCGMFITVI